MMEKRCAILSMDSLEDFHAYDHLIEPYLAELGWQTETISWRAQNVNWSDFDAVIIRTPWDYQDDAAAFIQVLERIEASSAHLENAIEIVRWNIDKIYLQQLEQQGVSVVPTRWFDKLDDKLLTAEQLDIMFEQLNRDQIVLKPRISANSDNTFWLHRSTAAQELAELNSAFAHRNFMAQPFMDSVIAEGEFSLFYFNGEYSHAILKTPKKQDFRVQEEHGGQLQSIEPEAELVKQANWCIEQIASIHTMPLYARVDFVRYQESFALMEAELIEPSLYFNMDEQSPKRFAQAFVAKMKQLTL